MISRDMPPFWMTPPSIAFDQCITGILQRQVSRALWQARMHVRLERNRWKSAGKKWVVLRLCNIKHRVCRSGRPDTSALDSGAAPLRNELRVHVLAPHYAVGCAAGALHLHPAYLQELIQLGLHERVVLGGSYVPFDLDEAYICSQTMPHRLRWHLLSGIAHTCTSCAASLHKYCKGTLYMFAWIAGPCHSTVPWTDASTN